MTKSKRKFIVPYRCGDVVVTNKRVNGWPVGERHIILDIAVYALNDYEYATNRGAWIKHHAFTLIHKCNEQSLREVIRASL